MQYKGIIILFIIDYVGINKVLVILKSNSGMKRYAGKGRHPDTEQGLINS